MPLRCPHRRIVLVACVIAAALLPALAIAAGAELAPKDLLKEPDGLEFRFGHLPSLHRLRLHVLGVPEQYVKWEAVLVPQGKNDVLSRGEGALPWPKAGQTIETPSLADGIYEVRFTLLAADGSRREVRRTFERKHFPWENSPLGRDRVVIPPFTPMVVEDHPPRVDCVLRQHAFDGSGLWSQVVAQGHELLASPVRLEVESEGTLSTAAGRGITFTEKSNDRVQAGAAWTAGPIEGRTEWAFEYDGLLKTTLHFGRAGQRLDAMRLILPLRTGEASLMHPVTDLLRFHYAGRIPNGRGTVWDGGGKRQEVLYTGTGEPDASGKVWDSRHVGRWQLPGPLVPYIWLGGPERGIAWFAENDRDWSLAADRPALEIRRVGPVTSLVVHLVNRPVTLSRPRTIVFGLMATPAKPMPADPVSFRRWWTGPPLEGCRDVAGCGFMGACYYWGGAGPCYPFWPAFKNFGIYDEFARLRRGGEMNPAFTDQWLAQFTAAEFHPHLKTYRAHVDWSVHFFSRERWNPPAGSGQTAYVVPYTNGRGTPWGEEVRTFADEWSTLDVADPRWPGEERFVRTPDHGYRLAAYGKVAAPDDTMGVAYATDPVTSWQDMVLHYHRRMLETFADGIYYDDYFLVPNYGPLGPGYVDDEGNLHPGVNIFAFRELTRRTAVMQYRMGRRPMVFLHMTNTNIVPILSFGTMILDHEWRDQGDWRQKTCQERLSLDDDTGLLLAQSTGLQSGCLGIALDIFHPDERLVRTGLGVALTHEMRMNVNGGGIFARVGKLLGDFGYGLSDCRVWRYWDDAVPLRTSGVPVKTLLLARGGSAMAVVTSYGPGGDAILRFDAPALGLPAGAEATNAETGEKLERLADGQFRLSLPKHDFRLIRVTLPVPTGKP